MMPTKQQRRAYDKHSLEDHPLFSIIQKERIHLFEGFRPFIKGYTSMRLRDYLPLLPEYLPDLSIPFNFTSLSKELKDCIITTGEHEKNYSFVHLTIRDYLQFTKDGIRTTYQTPYFQNRKVLSDLVVAYKVTHEMQYLNPILDGIDSLCSENCWTIPPHSYHGTDNNTRMPLYDIDKPVLALFSLETGALLAMIYTLLAEELDQITPMLRRHIYQTIRKRILEPYLTEYFWWMGKGDKPLNNWTTWCSTNMLICIFLLPTSQEYRHAALKKIFTSLDYFMDGYGEDGGCPEGPSYFHKAGLALMDCLRIINQITNHLIKPLCTEKKTVHIATYIYKIHATGPYFFNYSDCKARPEPVGVREFLAGKLVKSRAMQDFVKQQWKDETPEQKLLLETHDLYEKVINVSFAREIDAYQPSKDASAPPHQTYLPSIGAAIFHDQTYHLYVNVTHNGATHTHNDAGNIILYKKDTPVFIDVGVEEYTRKTFSPQRYDIWTMQSLYHNVSNFPTNGKQNQQHFGVTYAPTHIERKTEQHGDHPIYEIACNLEEAYQKEEAHLLYYRRSVRFETNTGITIKEDVNRDAVLTLMTCLRPESNYQQNEIKLYQTEEDREKDHAFALFHVENAMDIGIETIPITDKRLLDDWPDTLYRILISYHKRLSIFIH